MRISDADLKKLLLDSGKVEADKFKEVETFSQQSREPLLSAIIKRKLISEKELMELYGKSIDVPYVELANIKVPRELLIKIPERIARKYQAVIFGQEPDKKLQLAMADPEDFQAADFIEKQIGSEVKIYLAPAGDVLSIIDQYKGNIDTEITKAIKDSSDEEEAQEVSAKELAEDAPIAKTVNIVLEYAMKSRASDIHIEPRESLIQVRYRVDGILRESMTLPKSIMPAVVSRIKIMANLKIDEHRIPQDGRFKFSVGSKTVAVRVSTLPIMDGEKVVMRLLDESSKALTLEELGFEGSALAVIQRNLKKPHGMTLVTGPTGSGKSTTLYSVLTQLNTPGVNISTVEDPVEYRVTGVNQTQVNPKAGMTFATGLRALLRQDPNIIMVGEIRDKETADLAVQASLTGHIVLSTLHTNNAATTLPRLLDMGIEPFLIASTVNTVIGQRLVRRLCANCKIPYIPEGQELEDLKKEFQVEELLKVTELKMKPAAKEPTKLRKEKVIKPEHELKDGDDSILDKIASDPNIIDRSAEEAAGAKTATKTKVIASTTKVASKPSPTDAKKLKPGQFMLYHPGEGCKECTLGYGGRMGIYEVLEVSEEVSKLIVSHATSEEIQRMAISQGMHTMQQDGFLKALSGLTTVEEILRVTKE